jgi:hypothetical protein
MLGPVSSIDQISENPLYTSIYDAKKYYKISKIICIWHHKFKMTTQIWTPGPATVMVYWKIIFGSWCIEKIIYGDNSIVHGVLFR